MNSAVQDRIERTIVINAPKARVYQAITDPAQIVLWFPDGIEGSLNVGDRPTLDFGEYGKNKIYVEAADPTDYFAYRWVSGSVTIPEGFLGDVLTVPHTLVEFRLSEVADGTKVSLTESGFASLNIEVAQKTFDDNSGGWTYMLDRLAKYFEQA